MWKSKCPSLIVIKWSEQSMIVASDLLPSQQDVVNKYLHLHTKNTHLHDISERVYYLWTVPQNWSVPSWENLKMYSFYNFTEYFNPVLPRGSKFTLRTYLSLSWSLHAFNLPFWALKKLNSRYADQVLITLARVWTKFVESKIETYVFETLVLKLCQCSYLCGFKTKWLVRKSKLHIYFGQNQDYWQAWIYLVSL